MTPQQANELLPCPLCGSAALIEEHEAHSHAGGLAAFMPDYPGSFTAECTGAGCNMGLIADTRPELVAMWNRRAPAPTEPAVDRTKLRPMQNDDDLLAGIVRQWYFDCDGHYIDVALDDGKYSIFFKDRARKGEAWLDQADEVATPASPAVPAVPGECTEDMWFATTHIRNDIERADIEAMWRAMLAAAPQVAQASQWKWPRFEDWLASPITPPVNQVEYVRLAFNAGREHASQPTSAEGETTKPTEGQSLASLEAAQGDGEDLDAMIDLIEAVTKAETNGGALGVVAKYRRDIREKLIAAQPAPTSAEGKDSERLDWLDRQSFSYGFEDMHEGNEWSIKGPFASIRAAIDAGRASTGKDTDKEAK